MSDVTDNVSPPDAAPAEVTVSPTRIGLDLVRATPALRSEVMRLAALAGLRPSRVVITTGAHSPLGPRVISYAVVDVPDAFNAEVLVPRDRIAPIQWQVVHRGDAHLHAIATGVKLWLVVAGDIMPIVHGPAPGPGTPGTSNVVEYARAA